MAKGETLRNFGHFTKDMKEKWRAQEEDEDKDTNPTSNTNKDKTDDIDTEAEPNTTTTANPSTNKEKFRDRTKYFKEFLSNANLNHNPINSTSNSNSNTNSNTQATPTLSADSSLFPRQRTKSTPAAASIHQTLATTIPEEQRQDSKDTTQPLQPTGADEPQKLSNLRGNHRTRELEISDVQPNINNPSKEATNELVEPNLVDENLESEDQTGMRDSADLQKKKEKKRRKKKECEFTTMWPTQVHIESSTIGIDEC